MNKTHQQSLRKASHTTDCGCNYNSKGTHDHIGDSLPPNLGYDRDPNRNDPNKVYVLLPNVDPDIVKYVLTQEQNLRQNLRQTAFRSYFEDGWTAAVFRNQSGVPENLIVQYETWIVAVIWLANQYMYERLEKRATDEKKQHIANVLELELASIILRIFEYHGPTMTTRDLLGFVRARANHLWPGTRRATDEQRKNMTDVLRTLLVMDGGFVSVDKLVFEVRDGLEEELSDLEDEELYLNAKHIARKLFISTIHRTVA